MDDSGRCPYSSKNIIESLFSFLGSTLGIVLVIVILLSTIGGVALVGMKIRENRLIAEAYAEFKVELNPQSKSGLGGTELPAALTYPLYSRCKAPIQQQQPNLFLCLNHQNIPTHTG